MAKAPEAETAEPLEKPYRTPPGSRLDQDAPGLATAACPKGRTACRQVHIVAAALAQACRPLEAAALAHTCRTLEAAASPTSRAAVAEAALASRAAVALGSA